MSVRNKLRGNWLITVPLVGLTIGYVCLFDRPARRRSQELQSELEASQANVALGPLIMAQIDQAESQLVRTNAFVEAWRETAPKGAGSAVLLGQISRLARDAGTRTTRLEPGTAAAADHEELRSLALTLVCLGSFEQVFDLLRSVEALPQSVWIDDLRVERKQGNGGDLQCELKLAVFAGKSEISN